jgi:hypothetical protein
VPLYAFVLHWWPAFERYCRGELAPNESAVVLFGVLVFGGFFFVIGVVMLAAGVRSLARVSGDGDIDANMATRVTPEDIAESRSRVMGFPRLVHLPRAARSRRGYWSAYRFPSMLPT